MDKKIKITATKSEPGPNVTAELRAQIAQLTQVGQYLEQVIRGHMMWHERQEQDTTETEIWNNLDERVTQLENAMDNHAHGDYEDIPAFGP